MSAFLEFSQLEALKVALYFCISNCIKAAVNEAGIYAKDANVHEIKKEFMHQFYTTAGGSDVLTEHSEGVKRGH